MATRIINFEHVSTPDNATIHDVLGPDSSRYCSGIFSIGMVAICARRPHRTMRGRECWLVLTGKSGRLSLAHTSKRS